MSERTALFLVSLSHVWFPFLLPLPVIFGFGLRSLGRWQAAQGVNAPCLPSIRLAGVTCVVLFTLSLAVLGVAFLHLGCAALVAHQSTCRANLQQLSAAIFLYAQDHDDRFPPTDHWAEAIAPYASKVSTDRASTNPFRCPAASTPGSYGMNPALSSLREADLDSPSELVLLFDADAPARSFTGGPPDVAWRRHGGAPNVAYADGHVRYVTPYMRSRLQWSPKGASAAP